jgi:hypothetical protein
MITFQPPQQQQPGFGTQGASAAMPAADFKTLPNTQAADLAPLIVALINAKKKNAAPFKVPSVAKGTAMSDAAGGNSIAPTPVAADAQPSGSMDA